MAFLRSAVGIPALLAIWTNTTAIPSRLSCKRPRPILYSMQDSMLSVVGIVCGCFVCTTDMSVGSSSSCVEHGRYLCLSLAKPGMKTC